MTENHASGSPRSAIWRRSAEIANVLTRHGLGYLVGELGLERFLPIHRGWLGHAARSTPYTRPEHVRLCLEELGTTFVKLGQILSTRADLLPPEYIRELARLQDGAPPVDPDTVLRTVEEELGRPANEAFAEFAATPLAAASIGQAHAARLHDGTEVVVKVRRPGVVELVEADLEIMGNLAMVANRRWEAAANYDLVALAEEFAQTLRGELDYLREGRNAERFAQNFANQTDVHVPRVAWETTTSRVLTLERIRGVKINDLAELEAAGVERPALAERAAHMVLQMVFEDGFFHADPHPGNLFVEPGGRIGLIDFGLVGTVDERTQLHLADLLAAITARDPDRLVDAFLELGFARGRVDRPALRRDLDHLIERYYGQPLGEMRIGPLLEDALTVVRHHRLQLPANLALLLKTAAMCEGLGAQLDPSFRLSSVLTPYARRLIMRQYAPDRLLRRFGRAGVEATALGLELPQRLRRLLGEVERGNLEIGVHPQGVEPVVRRFEQLANRVVLGIITAAFVNGLAVLMSVYHPPGWEQWAGYAFGVGFALAASLGVYLAWTIVRGGTR